MFQFRKKAESDVTPVDWQKEATTHSVSGVSVTAGLSATAVVAPGPAPLNLTADLFSVAHAQGYPAGSSGAVQQMLILACRPHSCRVVPAAGTTSE